MVVGRMSGGVGCHTKSKGAELSYKIGYLIMAASFCLICPIRPIRRISLTRRITPITPSSLTSSITLIIRNILISRMCGMCISLCTYIY